MYCVWITRVCLLFLLAFNLRTLCSPYDLVQSVRHVMGKVTFHQKEGGLTYLRESRELAANVPTMISFQLSDQQRNLRTFRFTYTWDLGNGDVIVGSDPVMQCRYASSGNYKFKLDVGVRINKVVRLTGLYSMDLTVLDAISSIELKGPLSYSVNQSSSLSFLIAGSLPAWLCWRVLPNCRSLSHVSCKMERLYERQFELNYTFKSLGTHCLDLNAQNDISELQASYSVYVQKNPVSVLIFILPCASLIIAAVIFIAISVCRPQQVLLQSNKREATGYLSFANTEHQTNEVDNPEGIQSLIISESNKSEALSHT